MRTVEFVAREKHEREAGMACSAEYLRYGHKHYASNICLEEAKRIRAKGLPARVHLLNRRWKKNMKGLCHPFHTQRKAAAHSHTAEE